MKRDRLFTGMLLLCIGILFLLDNFNVINFHWSNILSLWPLLLIVSGVNLVTSHYNSTGITTLRALIFAAVLGIVAYRGLQPPNHHFFGRQFGNHFFNGDNDFNIDDDDDNEKGVMKLEGSRTYNEPYSAAVKTVSLNIKGGGATYVLQDTTNQLFSASTHEMSGKFNFNTMATDSGKTINFNTSSSRNSINWDNDDKGNQANIKLNINPVWDIDIASGASKMDLDLSKFKVRKLLVKGGATSMDLKLGQPMAVMNVDVSTGVSEVNISVPSNAACHIISKTGLSSKSFDGFESKSDNEYQTAGFDNAPRKIYLNLKGGISDFNVKRY
ncbi:DUF5668 domain-containing protein [uncultured Mucilaginibacter sp.]|uniref:LiaI-LiaF-like domain-containing protein n=1 Tax=uncultured Mucilaginibacter sp. TaxID=797541 RepID=UPI0026070E25|nr:DUF5668 domain-containing protein [uncultured Mucilaginibacter sp.]